MNLIAIIESALEAKEKEIEVNIQHINRFYLFQNVGINEWTKGVLSLRSIQKEIRSKDCRSSENKVCIAQKAEVFEHIFYTCFLLRYKMIYKNSLEQLRECISEQFKKKSFLVLDTSMFSESPMLKMQNSTELAKLRAAIRTWNQYDLHLSSEESSALCVMLKFVSNYLIGSLYHWFFHASATKSSLSEFVEEISNSNEFLIPDLVEPIKIAITLFFQIEELSEVQVADMSRINKLELIYDRISFCISRTLKRVLKEKIDSIKLRFQNLNIFNSEIEKRRTDLTILLDRINEVSNNQNNTIEDESFDLIEYFERLPLMSQLHLLANNYDDIHGDRKDIKRRLLDLIAVANQNINLFDCAVKSLEETINIIITFFLKSGVSLIGIRMQRNKFHENIKEPIENLLKDLIDKVKMRSKDSKNVYIWANFLQNILRFFNSINADNQTGDDESFRSSINCIPVQSKNRLERFIQSLKSQRESILEGLPESLNSSDRPIRRETNEPLDELITKRHRTASGLSERIPPQKKIKDSTITYSNNAISEVKLNTTNKGVASSAEYMDCSNESVKNVEVICDNPLNYQGCLDELDYIIAEENKSQGTNNYSEDKSLDSVSVYVRPGAEITPQPWISKKFKLSEMINCIKSIRIDANENQLELLTEKYEASDLGKLLLLYTMNYSSPAPPSHCAMISYYLFHIENLSLSSPASLCSWTREPHISCSGVSGLLSRFFYLSSLSQS